MIKENSLQAELQINEEDQRAIDWLTKNRKERLLSSKIIGSMISQGIEMRNFSNEESVKFILDSTDGVKRMVCIVGEGVQYQFSAPVLKSCLRTNAISKGFSPRGELFFVPYPVVDEENGVDVGNSSILIFSIKQFFDLQELTKNI